MSKRSYKVAAFVDSTEDEAPVIDLTLDSAQGATRHGSISADDELTSADKRTSKRRKTTIKIHRPHSPRDLVHQALHNETLSSKTTRAILSIPDLPLSHQQIARLRGIGALGPRFLGRCATAESVGAERWQKKSNGLTTETQLLPGASVHDRHSCHKRLDSMSQREQAYMLGGHLMCRAASGDEFLSYSKDPLFPFWLLFKRYSVGDTKATLQFFDRTKALAHNGEPAPLYPALDLCELLDVPTALLWKHGPQHTHELVSHGPLRLEDPPMRQATAQELIRDGIESIWSPLVPKAGQAYPKACKLRSKSFPDYQYTGSVAVPMTRRLLRIVHKVALNFVHIPAGQHNHQPPLHIFLSLCSLQKRRVECPILMQWIAKHYTDQDILKLYNDPSGRILPGFTRVAHNLPNFEQYLDLIRDCIAVFPHLPRLPETEIEAIPDQYRRENGG